VLVGLGVLIVLVMFFVHFVGAECVDLYFFICIVVGVFGGPNLMYCGEPGWSGRVNWLSEVFW